MSMMFGRKIYVPDLERSAAQGRPTVLVALSVKDGAEFLGEAIESALDQEGVDVTLEVYDNGSTDGSQDIALSYADRGVVLVENPPGLNYFCSMNRAIAGCTAEFFVPWACDDVMLPDNLQLKAAALREHPDAGFVWSPSLILDDENRVHDFYPSVQKLDTHTPAPGFFPFLVPIGQVVMSSVMARPEAMQAVGGFDARSVLVGDWLCWMKLAMRYAVVTMPYALIHYRQHEGCGSFEAKKGGYAEQEPAVLREAFRDPYFLPEWRMHAGQWMASLMAHVAHGLLQNDLLRWQRGFPAYALAGQALQFLPGAVKLQKYFTDLVNAAGLTPPSFPCTMVSQPALDGEAFCSMAEQFRVLLAAGLTDRMIAVVPDGSADQADRLMKDAIRAGGRLDVEVVSAPLEETLRRGMAFVGPFGSPHLAEAEVLGVPALVHEVPDCFDRPRDPERWETLDGPRAARATA
jgi:hypothetical protein